MSLVIQLVNMPFGDIQRPSIGLTQLKARATQIYGPRVSVGINYLNLELARMVGPVIYRYIASHQNGLISGLGEWLFRQAAFPELENNRESYLTRFGHHFGPELRQIFEKQLEPVRNRLNEILDELIERYRLHQADIVGFSSTFFQNLASTALARRLRNRRQDQIVIIGGANCEGVMGIDLIANLPVFDFVFSGHSLVSFPEFIGNILAGDRDACHRIDGVFSRRNSHLVATAMRTTETKSSGQAKMDVGVAQVGRELDINATVELDYDDFFASLDRLLPKTSFTPVIPFETSRGCWWGERAHCTFCGLNGSTMAYRAMEPGRATALIEGLVARYSSRSTRFECVDNILPREYVDAVFGKLRPPKDISFFYEVKADLNEVQLSTLAAGGVREIQPGIESLATSTLKLMRKGTTAFSNIKFLMQCQACGITPYWNLLVGFPGETAEVYAAYLRVLPSLFHLPPPGDAYPVRFDRFSPYFVAPEEFHLKLEPYDFYEFCYPFPKKTLRNIAYYFQDTNYASRYVADLAVAFANLRQIVQRWRQCWASKNEALRPRLVLCSDIRGHNIEDTRSGSLIKAPLSALELALLNETVRPTDEARIADKYGKALDLVRQKQLIFTERGRVMSIVAKLGHAHTNQKGAKEENEPQVMAIT